MDMNPVAILVLIIAGFVVLKLVFRAAQAKARRDRIYQKYGRTEVADRIFKKVVWVGETAAQLRDSLGNPLDIDEKVLRTKRKEIWKYIRKGTNRYGLRITVENGEVIGWDEKL